MSYHADNLIGTIEKWWPVLPLHVKLEMLGAYIDDADDPTDLENAKEHMLCNIQDDAEYASEFACELVDLALCAVARSKVKILTEAQEALYRQDLK